ncbi:MAG TPA: hypothetical protein PL070_19750 [Flavobacteriales bacterium]|nr:hypothetical protein [Flavobacteriales bacterium]
MSDLVEYHEDEQFFTYQRMVYETLRNTDIGCAGALIRDEGEWLAVLIIRV